MANAQVEKLKALGLRHGEKAVVGLSALVCFFLLVLAVTKKSIDVTPDQVSKDAKAAQANLDRKQDNADILKTLEDQGIKDVAYAKLVEDQSKTKLVADNYRIVQAWVTPEPGAGLIRDTPQLVAPIELVAYPGRGGALVFDLDDEGKRKPEDPEKKQDTTTTKRRGRRRNRSRSMMGAMMMGAMPGMGGMMGAPQGEETEEAKKERLRKARQLKALLAGKDKPESDKPKEKGKEGEAAPEETTPEDNGPWKEITKGLRWVSITGVLDHKKMRDNYVAALKNPAAAPNYKQLDVQRQVLQSDGTWSDWEDVDIEKNRAILFNLPETEEELAAETAIIENLVAPLPFLKAGLWEKVHVASLVPKEKKEVPKEGVAGGMGGPAGAMYGGGSGAMSAMGAMKGAMMGASGPAGGFAGMGGSGSGAMYAGMGGSGMGGSLGGGEETLNFQKSEADTVMIRSLDFTVEPDTTYKFRLRVVVFNPNYNREDIAPGVDSKGLELQGPWSDPTDEVHMPADVTAYAMQKTPAAGSAKRTDQVTFQVAKFDPKEGVTVVRNFDAGPGEVIGDVRSAAIPVSDGTGAKNKAIDFNSRQLVVDTAGGPKPIAPVGATGAPLDAPALSLLLRSDGTVVVRNEVSDLPDTVRKDMSENYLREVKDSGKKRESSFGAGMGMGAYGGMMGSGMPGMGGGRRRGGGFR